MTHDNSETERWRQQLKEALKTKAHYLNAVEFKKRSRSKSQPLWLECEDGQVYVVKTYDLAGRQVVNDQLAARLGELLNAPVGEPALIYIPQELIEGQSRDFEGIQVKIAHGSLFIPNCQDSWVLIATSEPENRLRLVLLAILYGWLVASDHQFLFTNTPPRLIYSVDHGHFFPNPPNWQAKDLQDSINVDLDPYFQDCNFNRDELQQALQKLSNISELDLIKTVAIIPQEWGFPMEDRLAMLKFLTIRKNELVKIVRRKILEF